MANTHNRKRSFVRQHSLSIASAGILILWICLYSVSSPGTHIGSFFGNAIADWSGVVVMVFATKYLYEKGSAESRRPPRNLLSPVRQRLRDHSLSLFLIVTGIGWIALFASMDSETKWGQVVGNIVSEMDADFRSRTVDETAHRATLKGERPEPSRLGLTPVSRGVFGLT